MILSLGLINFLGSQHSQKHIHWFIIVAIIRDTDEQPDEEMGRAGHGCSTGHRAISGHITLPQSSVNLFVQEFLLSSVSSRLFLLPFPGTGGWG